MGRGRQYGAVRYNPIFLIYARFYKFLTISES